MSKPTFLAQFSPQWTRPEALEEIFVQREDLLAGSVEKIRESILTAGKHHLLFIGPRGSGKSHLVTLIHHRLQDPRLLDRARFAWLNEDEIATSFLKLLVLIYRGLAERYPAEFSAATIPGLAGLDPAVAEEHLGRTLLRELGGQRTLVVLLENLDALFKTMPATELLRWRAFVQNHPVLATVATAQALFTGVASREEPFFGFFDTRHLDPLTVSEARLLLEKVARLQGRTELLDFLQTPAGRARVSAIHDLAGGNPRLYLIFSEFLDRAALDELVRPFEELVDRQLTSYYQERLRWLSPQQREIVQFLCHHGRPVPVKQIAEGLFTTHNSITGQLKPLRDMRYVSFRPLGREVLYELAEPLMRLALQVKETHNRKPLALIVDFLRVWHDRDELERRLAQLAPASRGRDYYVETLALLDSGAPNLRHELLRRGLESLPEEPCDDDTLATARCLAEESDEPADWVKVGSLLNSREEWEEAVRAFTVVIERQDAPVADLAVALCRRGLTHGKLGQLDAAIADFTRAIELLGAPVEDVAMALINRGVAQRKAGRQEAAIMDYTCAIELPGALVDDLAVALNYRGVVLSGSGRSEAAIADFTRAINLPGAPVEDLAMALNNRGVVLIGSGRSEAAIADFTRAIELAGAQVVNVATALVNRGVVHGKAGRPEAAIADYTRVINLPGAPAEQVAKALNNRGHTYYIGGRIDAALDDFGRFFSKIDSSSIPTDYIVTQLPSYAEIIIESLFAHTTEPRRWSNRITEFLAHFARLGGLPQLGDALVRHLPKLATSPLNHAAYDAWAGAWVTAGATLPPEQRDALTIPLRLLHAGIAHLKSGEESRLLVLPVEERKILRQVLNLPPE